MDPKTLASALEALNAALVALASTPAAPAVTPEPKSVWDGTLVASVNAVGRPRNAAGAFIKLERMQDPHGLMARWAQNPGTPVFWPDATSAAPKTAAPKTPTAPTAVASTLAEDAARVRAAFPEAMAALEALNALHVGRGKHTYRDVEEALGLRAPR